MLKIANKNDSGSVVDDGIGFCCLKNRSDARLIDEFVANTALNHSRRYPTHSLHKSAIGKRPSAKKLDTLSSDNQLPV